jgi:hypothetical protein
MLINLERFQHATSMDLDMGYYHLELSAKSQELCTMVLLFGKYECQCIAMGLGNSPDIFQEKMNKLLDGLSHEQAYIDDLLPQGQSYRDVKRLDTDDVMELARARGLRLGKVHLPRSGLPGIVPRERCTFPSQSGTHPSRSSAHQPLSYHV